MNKKERRENTLMYSLLIFLTIKGQKPNYAVAPDFSLASDFSLDSALFLLNRAFIS